MTHSNIDGDAGGSPLPRHLTPGFDRRVALLEHSWDFVQAARMIPGVVRIAMLGSLLTSKSAPKDCDVLVSVTTQVEISRLAKLGRRLKGRTGAMGSGADVFMCDAAHAYIGRVCQWRECWPRVACEARNCGKIPGLYDDLDTLTLSPEITLTPPLELFPAIVVRGSVPDDVQRILIAGSTHSTKS